MPLDPGRLENVHPHEDGGFTARCPACREEDSDHTGNHARQFADGSFACVVRPGDRAHRSRMWALAGLKTGITRDALPRVFLRKKTKEEKLHIEAEKFRPVILAQEWSRAALCARSPAVLPSRPQEQARAMLRLFQPADRLWIGDHKDSGHPRHARHFRTAREWLASPVCPAGPRICPASFNPGSFSRSAKNILRRRFLVVESDTLTYGQQGAVFRWLREQNGLRLRAVVDTGGRSLHGWFDLPTPGRLAELEIILPVFGSDPALFNPVQPCRLPGWPREDGGNLPKLLYLDPDPLCA